MLRVPTWIIDRLVSLGKINPADVLNQSMWDDIASMAHEVLRGWF